MKQANEIIRELIGVPYLEIKENNLCTFSATLNAIQAAEEYLATGGWVGIKDVPREKKVLLGWFNEYGYWRNHLGFYTDGGKIEFDDSDERFLECYDDNLGVSYLSKGSWLEAADYSGDCESIFIPCDATHFQYLPQPPKDIDLINNSSKSKG